MARQQHSEVLSPFPSEDFWFLQSVQTRCTDETLEKLSTDRYSSRFGTMRGGGVMHNLPTTIFPSSIPEAHDDGVYVLNRPKNGSQAAGQESKSTRPLPNEVRKRTVDKGKRK